MLLPYAVVRPYCTCELAPSFVDHDMVAPLVVTLEADMEEIVGRVVEIGRLQEAVFPPFEPRQDQR